MERWYYFIGRYYIREEWDKNMAKRWHYSTGRHHTIEERHNNVTEERCYSIGRHQIIEERRKNRTEERNYSIGRHCIIEMRHRNRTEERNYSIGRRYSVRDWCRNIMKFKRIRGDCLKFFDYGYPLPRMNNQDHFSYPRRSYGYGIRVHRHYSQYPKFSRLGG